MDSERPRATSSRNTFLLFDNRLWLALLYVPTAVLLLAVVAAASWTGKPFSQFTKDPSMLAGAHPLLGMLSNIGILLWTATAAVSLFTAAVLSNTALENERRSFLLVAGLVTAWLTLDDFFMLHEWIFPFVLGVPQPLVFVAYFAAFGVFVYLFRAVILATDYLLFVLAVMAFALSVGTDELPTAWFAWDYLTLIEDGTKFVGIVSWFGYFGHVCAETLANSRLP